MRRKMLRVKDPRQEKNSSEFFDLLRVISSKVG